MMRAPGVFAGAAAAAILAASTAVRADEPGPDTLPMTVIAVQTPDADDQAEALTKSLRTAVRTMPGWSLAQGDYSLEVLTLSLKCPEPPDANCQSRIADQIKIDRYVWGMLAKKGKKSSTVVADLHLWVRGKGTTDYTVEYSANLTDQNDDALRAISREAMTKLTGGPPKGSLRVHAGKVAGQVFVDGHPVGALKNGEGSFMVPAGPHKVTVKAVGYADTETQVVVKATGAPVEVRATMLESGSRGPVNGKMVGGYTALGVGVAAAVVGVISVAQVKSAQSSFNEKAAKESKDTNVCDKPSHPDIDIDSACSKGKTFQTMQMIFFPVAAVAGGVGIFLLATAGKSSPAPARAGWQVLPLVGPTGGRLDLTYTF